MQYYSKYRGRKKFLSDINVTPFVDVMLVLLIIFMITAPLLTTGIKINLPKSAANQISEKKERQSSVASAVDKIKSSLSDEENAVSYTHLTLPTIFRV